MENFKRKIIIIVGLVAVMLLGSFYGYLQKTKAVEVTNINREQMVSTTNDKVPAKSLVMVYITGAVNKPGMYNVEKNLRVAEALKAAGGLLPTADINKVNIAKKVKDGMHIKVAEIKVRSNKSSCASENKLNLKTTKININLADMAELEQLPGIGPSLAERIIHYRETNGIFKDISELNKVPGIGKAKFEKLRDKIVLHE